MDICMILFYGSCLVFPFIYTVGLIIVIVWAARGLWSMRGSYNEWKVMYTFALIISLLMLIFPYAYVITNLLLFFAE